MTMAVSAQLAISSGSMIAFKFMRLNPSVVHIRRMEEPLPHVRFAPNLDPDRLDLGSLLQKLTGCTNVTGKQR